MSSEGVCRRPSAVVNLNCVTNRAAQGPRYKLSYDAEQYNTIHTLLNIPYRVRARDARVRVMRAITKTPL